MARCWLCSRRGLWLAVFAACYVAAAQPTTQVVEEATDPEYTVQFTFSSPAQWPGDGEIRILFDQAESGAGYALVISGKDCRFARTDGARMTGLGKASAWEPVAGPCRGVLKRRRSRMVAHINSNRVATAQDAALHGGAVSWTATDEALVLDDIYVQPVVEVEFTDDFVREEGSFGAWEALAGDWQTVSPEGEALSPDKSANPFSLRGTAGGSDELALATAGDWFWDDYRVKVAAKGTSTGAMGVAAYVQDARNFLLFRWTSTGGRVGEPEGRKQLVRVRDGRWMVLGQAPGGFCPERWYELCLSVCDGYLQASVDGQVAVTAHDYAFGQGRIGLFSQEIAAASFDDVDVRTTRDWVEAFDLDELGWLQEESGDWRCSQNHLYGSIKGSRGAEVWVGDADWTHYEIAADVKPKSAAAVGLQACLQEDGARYVFRWEAGGRQALLLARGHTQTVLAEREASLSSTRFYRLGLRAVHGHIVGTVDGEPVLQAANTQLLHGRSGLLVAGPGEACFDDLSVAFTETQPSEFRVTAQFTREETMKNWVDPSRQWQQAEDGTFWYDVPLFGDFTMWLPELDLAAAGGALTIVAAPGPGETGGPRVVVTTEAGSPAVSAQGLRGDKTQAESRAEADPGGRLRVVRSGECISVWSGRQPILAWQDEGLGGQALGLRCEGLDFSMSEVRMDSPHLMDVTFAGAPTGWAPCLGTWRTMDRWPCYRGWSWFGGSGHESPLLWSKDTLQGDQVLEFWAALLMDMDKEPGYSHPSDINATICGDGEKLCSGYNFVLAGANNTKSMIMKGDQIVAESTEVKFDNPVSMNLNFQRHWFDIRIEKKGSHLTFAVDGKQVAEWTDPDPLPGGKAGFWSWNNNGIVIARTRLAAESIHR